MNKFIITLTALSTTLALSACTGNIRDVIPDRRPDYRQSSVGKQLEIPPNLSSAAIDDQLIIPDFNPNIIASYQAYQQDNAIRNSRGYIEVLPELYGVEVIETNGALPYLLVNNDATTTWQLVKRYWDNNGIRLTTQEPSLGIMQTDWLENRANTPSAGLSGFIGSLVEFISDSGERDRYRIQFSKVSPTTTQVTLLYTQAVEEPQYDRLSGKDPSGFAWSLSDNDNPALQLEMTRRLALFISAEQRRQHHNTNATQAHQNTGIQTQLTLLPDAQPALIINGEYAYAWRILGIALDNASFAFEQQNQNDGAYLVRYAPQSDAKTNQQSLWNKLWGNQPQNTQAPHRPHYLVRLADQGQHSIVIIQTAQGQPLEPSQARAVLETIQAHL